MHHSNQPVFLSSPGIKRCYFKIKIKRWYFKTAAFDNIKQFCVIGILDLSPYPDQQQFSWKAESWAAAQVSDLHCQNWLFALSVPSLTSY